MVYELDISISPRYTAGDISPNFPRYTAGDISPNFPGTQKAIFSVLPHVHSRCYMSQITIK